MRRTLRSRLRFITGVILLIALFLIVRLYFVQVVQGKEYALRGQHQYVSASQQLYDRGTIYFTRKDGTLVSGAALATGFTLAIDPEQIKDAEAVYATLSKHLPLDRDAFTRAAAKTSDPYEVLATRVSEDIGHAISAEKIPGVIVELERWRVYPAGTEAARLLGFVAYDDGNALAGRYGLERYYETTLERSGNGLFGNFFAQLFANLGSVVADAKSAREGDVITSIEPVVQQKLDQILAATNAQYSSQETGGIIMDPSTGAIIAADVVPSFDPNNFKGASAELFGNPLVQHEYEFGSIFKTLTMASGLDAGVITQQTTYNDTGCIEVNKSRICNFDLKARGVIPMQEILNQSLNVGASFVATKLGHERFRQYFTSLGLGEKTGVDLPSEVAGDIHNILTSPRDVEYDTASFGQGIATTPIETMRALAALAGHGAIVTPHVATAIRLENGIVKPLTYAAPRQVFRTTTTDQLAKMLTIVVDTKLGHGTVKIPEMSVAAKTGTAQIAGPGGKYFANLYFHSFFGYFPASNPRYAILLYTREPQGVQYASETLTAPFMTMTHFLINYYDIPPDRATFMKPAP